MTQDNYLTYTRFVAQELDNKTTNVVETDLGINRAYLYAIKKGDFVNIKKHHFDLLDAAIERQRNDNTEGWQVALTTNLSIASGTLKKAQTERLCLALTGTTGFGKTEACKLYRRKNSDVVYIHCNTEMTKSGFLDGIAADLSIPHGHRGYSVEARFKAIITHLMKLKNPLLIIDDAGKLRDSAFRMFQILFDESAGRIGFVLTGVPEFRQKVFKLADKGVFCYKEIARRIGWVELSSIFVKDVAAICHRNGIIDDSAISYLCDNIGDYDTLRRTIKAAQSAATKQDVAVTRALLSGLNGAITNYRVSFVQA